MTPEETALKASIEQRLKKLSPTVINTGTGLRVQSRGKELFISFIPSPPVTTKNIS